MAKNGNSYRIGTGATSLLMVLVILCLTILSALSYSSATSEKRLSDETSNVTHAVLEAGNEAEHQLAALDAMILSAREDSADMEDLLAVLAEELEEASSYAVLEDDVLSFSIPTTESLTLSVALRVNSPEEKDRYTVIRWTTSAAEESEEIEEEYLDLWTGK